MVKHVFGPVPSRRLGQSLGIDPVPSKTCNWNCVYCQLGRTYPFTTERDSFIDDEKILSEVREVLESHRPGGIDWITFVGSGETCLHTGLGELIRGVKSLTDIPVAAITNGSLLFMPEVRKALLPADAVLPSLDAGNPDLYHKINRPHPAFTFERLVNGLIDFRKEYKNNLWVEVMLVRGLNDGEAALREIAAWMEKIRPDEIHIVQPTRPPVEMWVEPPDEVGLRRARAILGGIAKLTLPVSGTYDLSIGDDLIDAILGIITRHPMKESELIESLKKWSQDNVKETLNVLKKSGRARVVIRSNTRFWSASEASYPDKHQDHD
jgi:wyosine [tRNA(Phe)-imidazoG37] synthetase (radical SAM superfamily)